MFYKGFSSPINNDNNRIEDAYILRARYANEEGIDSSIANDSIAMYGPNLLEVLVALADRCGNGYLWDQENGVSTAPIIFYDWLSNVKLWSQTNDNFDERFVNDILDRIINRTYGPDGRGGLFPLKRPREDVRNVDIWYQLMWYISEKDENA